MTKYEYRVVPAPVRATKVKGVKGTARRFAQTLEDLMNELGAEGWEYLRADTLPVEERHGLTSKTTAFQNMLVFRRPQPEDAPPLLIEAPTDEETALEAADELIVEAEGEPITDADATQLAGDAAQMDELAKSS